MPREPVGRERQQALVLMQSDYGGRDNKIKRFVSRGSILGTGVLYGFPLCKCGFDR